MATEHEAAEDSCPVELLHPFYLDTDMSMAFAAALAGGVALEREDVEHGTHESQEVRNLRGNLRLFGIFGPGGGAGGLAGEREAAETEFGSIGSRFVRHHTEVSIFIALHNELRRTHRIRDGADHSTLSAGDIVSLSIGPAVAPLRRVVDQFIRLIDVAAPFVGLSDDDQDDPGVGQTRQQRRQGARQAAKQSMATGDRNAGVDQLRALRRILVAFQDDLDRSGMVDIVVAREEAPSVVLTLDKRFVTDQGLELLHTSRFTVVGKVTRVWPTDAEGVNLYRRSVLSLVPALAQTWGWGMFALLATVAGSMDPASAEAAARAAARVAPSGDLATAASEEGGDETGDDRVPRPREDNQEENSPETKGTDEPEIMLGDDAVAALSPWVSGPAIQLLPLAICA